MSPPTPPSNNAKHRPPGPGRVAHVYIEGKPALRCELRPHEAPPSRVLIVTRDPALTRRAVRAVGLRAVCLIARDPIEALALVLSIEKSTSSGIDGALIDHAACAVESLDLAGELARRGTGVVLATDALDAGFLLRAAARGCRQTIARNLRVHELSRCLLIAAGFKVGKHAPMRGGRRLRRLNGLCRHRPHLAPAKARQAGAECSDQVGGHMECVANMNQVTTATEFKTLIKHELDIEQLLRTTLEFVLARSGPTNAAVFLPTTSGDYSLGAYVNYDCPKETVDMLLDHMANTIAPRFEPATTIVQLTDADSLEDFAGGEAAWLGESGVLGFACRHEGEVLAIVMLFRDRLSPFGPLLVDQLRTIGELFASQLARVIHVHHRHLPKEKWGCIGDPPGCDDEDLAA